MMKSTKLGAGVTYRFNPYTSLGESHITVISTTHSLHQQEYHHHQQSQGAFNQKRSATPPCPISMEDGLSDSGASGPTTPPTPYVAIQQHQQQQTLHHHRATPSPLQLDTASTTSSQQSILSLGAAGDVQGNVHRVLKSYPIKYASYKDLRVSAQSSNNSTPARQGNTVRLFVGQVLHEIGASQLKAIFESIAGVDILSVTPHGPGCFFIEIPSGQFRSARSLNGRVLFDVKGMWISNSMEDGKQLQSYMSGAKQSLKSMRLPRSALVVRK